MITKYYQQHCFRLQPRVLIDDAVESIPGVSKGPYEKKSLPEESISNGKGLDKDFDLPAKEALNFSSAELIDMKEGDKLYRVIGGKGSFATGGYWTRTKPKSYAEIIGGTSVKPEWNGFEEIVEYTVPKGGVKVWVGLTAPQEIVDNSNKYYRNFKSKYHLAGNAEQVYMPQIYRDYTNPAVMTIFDSCIRKEKITWVKK